jgi:DNA repair exonuclease SbcCD ATPase subunit
VANKEVDDWFGEQIKEKSKGRNHDLSVAEYKVAQETKHLTQLQKQVEESDRAVKANKAVEKEYTDKKEKLETDISYLESMRRITESLSEMDSRESKHISKELDEKRTELQSVNEELASAIEKAEDATKLLDRVKSFVSSFRLFAPTIEEYDNQVEADKTIEAGNSFHGILNELGKLLEAFKELIKEGLCWFPRLMRWKTSKGEVAPVFLEKSNGYSYSLCGYMDVETKEYYSKERIKREITAGNCTGAAEQIGADVEAMLRDLQEILRIGAEQRRLWEVYEGK